MSRTIGPCWLKLVVRTNSHHLSKGCTPLGNHCNHFWHLWSFGSRRLSHDRHASLILSVMNGGSYSKYTVPNLQQSCHMCIDYGLQGPYPRRTPIGLLVFRHALVLQPSTHDAFKFVIYFILFVFPGEHTSFLQRMKIDRTSQIIEGNI